MSTQIVYIMIGVIGSGKSTWARLHATTSTLIVSKDSIREMISGRYLFDPELEDLVGSMNQSMIHDALTNGRNVIVDECHVSRSTRLKMVEWIRANFPLVRITGVCCPSQSGNVDRRMKSSRGISREIWQTVFDRMVKQFEEPQITEFDDLIIVNKDLK